MENYLVLSDLCQPQGNALLWREQRQIYHLEPDTILSIENFTLENDLTLACNTPLKNYLECVYCLSCEGSIEYQRESWPRLEEPLARHHLWWQPCGQSCIKSRHPVKVVHIYFTPNGLTKYLGGNESVADRFVRIFTDQTNRYGQREGFLPPLMETIVHQIIHCSLNGLARRLFLHAKVEELLALEIEYWMDSQRTKGILLSNEDIFYLNRARDILFSLYQEPPSLSELARKTGINRHKLTTGFRQLFGTTVYAALMDIKDMQVTEQASAVEAYLTNAATATGKGMELEVMALLWDGLTLNACFGYNNTEFEDFRDIGGDYAGNKNPFVPQYTYNIGGQYRHDSGVYARTDLIGVGKMYFDKANNYSRDAYEVVNMKIGYEADSYDMYLYAKNIFDREYNSYGYYGGFQTIYSQPREIGIQLTYRF